MDDDTRPGRPRTLEKARICTAYLPEDMIDMAKALGHDNISRGIRIALEYARSKGVVHDAIQDRR